MIPYNKTANPQQLLQKVLSGEKVTFDFPGMVDDRFNFISGFIFRLLSLVDMVYLSEMLLVLLKEILSNCSKANAKRIFFEHSGVDINDAEQYKKLIPQFSRSVLKEWEVFHQQNQKSNYYIHINILKHNDSLEFMVENNAGILPQEWKRIQSKMDSFKKYDDISEAFSEIRDESEGAGLGIFFTLSLLSNAGIPPENYQLISSDGKTQTRIKIPLSLTPDSFKKKFYNRFLNEITELPSFPEHISSLLNLCESDTASVQIIAEHIRRDPSLTAQILKIVNSAGYMTRFRDPSLEDAVKIIGLKVIRNILMVSGARSAINKKYRVKNLETIWEDSNRVSFFARRLARGKGAVMEQVTVAGLLFELGKIVMLALKPDVIQFIQELQGDRRVRTSGVVEENLLGISHAEVGAHMAEKWNFPPHLVAAIRYQQKPLQAPEEYADLVRVIYLASMIHFAGMNQVDYWCVEPAILEEFGIGSPEVFDERVKQFNTDYQSGNG